MLHLKAGDEGAAAQFLQQRLNALGFGPVDETGVMDDATVTALQAFQLDRGLLDSGEADSDTWGQLLGVQFGASEPVSFGEEPPEPEPAEGEPLEEPDALDGIFSTEVAARLRVAGQKVAIGGDLEPAIRNFQAEYNLPQTGEVDTETWAVLLGVTAGADLLSVIDPAELEDQAGPDYFADGECREVPGAGGYLYRQYEDGSIEILEAPLDRLIGNVYYKGKAWEAITQQIGPWPHPKRDHVRGTVKANTRGPDALAVQQRLNELGFGPLVADGIFGQASVGALIRFQKAAGTDADGIVGDGTWKRLDDPWPVIEKGTKSAAVKDAQQRLNALGFPLNPDGDYGDKTANAVRAFQASKGLPETGTLDVRTRGALFAAQGVAVPAFVITEEKKQLEAAARAEVAKLPAAVRERVLKVLLEAIKWVGVREIGDTNTGPEVDILTAGYPGKGPPWCALAVNYWVREGQGLGSDKETPWGFQNASSMYYGRWGEQKGKVTVNTGTALPGSIMVMPRGGSGSDKAEATRTGPGRFDFKQGHTGMVLQDLGDSVITIDGNVSQMCKQVKRPKSSLLGYITWW